MTDNVSESIMFVLKETELCGIINLLSSILLVDGAFTKGS